MARPSAACASVMFSGESQRTTFGPAGVTIMPASSSFCARKMDGSLPFDFAAMASALSSKPMKRPSWLLAKI